MGRRGRCRFRGAPAGPAAGGAPQGPAQAAPPDRPRTQRARPRSQAEQTCLSEDRRGAGGACPLALPGAGARRARLARLAQKQPEGRRASAGSRRRAGHWPPCSLMAPPATTGQEHRAPWGGGAALRTPHRASRPPLLGAPLHGRPRGPSGQWFSSVKAVCAAPVSTLSPPPASKLHVPAAPEDFGAHLPGPHPGCRSPTVLCVPLSSTARHSTGRSGTAFVLRNKSCR